MRPTEHLDPSEDELIAHVKQSLTRHEEPYVPGAWEKFNEKESEKPVLWLWSISGVAAALLLSAGLFLYTNNDPEKTSADIASSGTVKINPVKSGDAKNPEINAFQPKQQISDGSKTEAVPVKKLIYRQDQGLMTASENVPFSNTGANTSANQPLVNQPVDVVPSRAAVPAKDNSFETFLKHESQVLAGNGSVKELNKKTNKWEMGVMVAPSIGSAKKLNMGYGVSMAYALSDKVSINSGIAYNEMAASKDIAAAPVTMGLAGTKDVESTEAKLVGIDIPLEIKYHVNKNVYANVGVSAFAVIGQQRNNTYLEGRVVQNSFVSVDGSQREESFAVKERVVEEVPVESEIKNGRYLGFYNFSVGYKQKVSKNNSISIEPFMKVPMKEVTKENLRMLGTGVRLKFDF